MPVKADEVLFACLQHHPAPVVVGDEHNLVAVGHVGLFFFKSDVAQDIPDVVVDVNLVRLKMMLADE